MNDAAQTVILISLDCVRPESLGCYPRRFPQAPAPATPHIDRLARHGVRFDQAVTQAPHTPASHASVFTGLLPHRHGVRAMVGHALAEQAVTLADRLAQAGFATAGFIGAHALGREYGLARGFDLYDDAFAEAQENWVLGSRRGCEESTGRAVAWLLDQRGPAFLFIHYFDCHDIGHSPETTVPDWQIRQTARIDAQVGRLIEAVERSGRTRSTLWGVFGDHGDSFGEHGETSHREYLYDTTLKIPLILQGPRFDTAQSVACQVRAIDIMPSVLESCAVPLDPASPPDGASLRATLTEPSDRPAYAETNHEASPERWHDYRLSFACFRRDGWKFILDRLTGACELYFLAADPHERTNLAHLQPSLCRRWREEITPFAAIPSDDPAEDASSHAMSPSETDLVLQRMKDLGYL